VRLYFAGVVKGTGSDAADSAVGVINRLLTFADVDGWAREAFAFWVENRRARANVFLDSGAFGAYTRGAEIDLERYCDYIRGHEAALECYAALDVIGDWRATQRNLDIMLARGLKPIPTFHRGSPWEVLDQLSGSFPYVALGGMAGGGGRALTTRKRLMPYLDECWRRLWRRWPIKVHAFGVIAQWVLERYPFYSADSSSAIVGAGMGRVGRWCHGRLRTLPWREDFDRRHDLLVADEAGKSVHAGRRRRNIEAQLALQRHVTELWAIRGVAWQ